MRYRGEKWNRSGHKSWNRTHRNNFDQPLMNTMEQSEESEQWFVPRRPPAHLIFTNIIQEEEELIALTNIFWTDEAADDILTEPSFAAKLHCICLCFTNRLFLWLSNASTQSFLVWAWRWWKGMLLHAGVGRPAEIYWRLTPARSLPGGKEICLKGCRHYQRAFFPKVAVSYISCSIDIVMQSSRVDQSLRVRRGGDYSGPESKDKQCSQSD